jgi:hypothetical protein
MANLHGFMPEFAFREIDRIAVAADPERAYAALRVVDLYRIPYVRGLFALRLAPELAAALMRGWAPSFPRHARIDDIVAPGSGFLVLDEEPGRELVIGSVGKFWKASIPFVRVTPETFASFREPGYGKLAYNLRVDPRREGGSWVGVELRVSATDREALAALRHYWRLIGPFSHAIRKSVLRLLREDLGAAPADARIALAGDEILPHARFHRTHARTFESPPEKVWPWLVQMGCQRAGWYSIDFLDNGSIPSAREIVTGLQHLEVGDVIPWRPHGKDGFTVLQMEPERALVLGAPGTTGPKTTWSFVLSPIGKDATRLIVRVRAELEIGPRAALASAFLVPAHEVMQRAQLRNLKLRVEGAGAASAH